MENVFNNHLPYKLLTATTANEGVELARALKTDLILMDIHLPDSNGFETFKVLQKFEETRDVPVIAVSANAMPNDVQKGLALGFKDYLTKPFEIEKLVSSIKLYLS
jgi:ribose transport system substrate-binding protein